MTDEYEDNESDLDENGEESHTFVTQFEPRKHRSAPLPEGATKRIQNELNRVERHLDLTKTAQLQRTDTLEYDEGFAETIKEQQARRFLETKFTQTPEKPTIGIQEQKLEQLMDSSPLTKLAQLKEENRQRRIQHQLDVMETSLTSTGQPALPTPPDTPPPKVSERFQALGQALEINRTTAATQWAIDAHNESTRKTTELPTHYHSHWWVFSEKLAQWFPLERKDDHAIKL